MQLQSEAVLKNSNLVKYKNSWDCVKSVIRKEGFFGLYNGLSASLLGLTESTLQFVMYEHFKARILETKRQAGEMSPSMSMSLYICYTHCILIPYTTFRLARDDCCCFNC